MSYNEYKEELSKDYKEAAQPDLTIRRFSGEEVEARSVRKEQEAIKNAETNPRVVDGKRDPYIVGCVEFMIG